MTTVASPVSVREQALGIIAEHLAAPAQVQDALGEIGAAVLVNLLIDLEKHFDIGLDVDELMPNGTIGVLIELVEIRAKAQGAGVRIYRWDDERARRALPLFRPPTRYAEVEPVEIVEAPETSGLPHGACGSCGRDATLNAGGVCLACFCDDKAIATPPPPISQVAAPSDAAWARAEALYAQERSRRFYLLVVAVVCSAGALGMGLAWSAGAGLL